MAGIEAHDGWLAACPYGFLVLERESAEFFLRTRDAVFPGMTIAQLFGIEDGPLHEEIVKNIINVNGDDHRRLRNLVNPALAPRAVARYRPAMRDFLTELLEAVAPAGECEFIAAIAKPYPSLVIAHVMGAPLAATPPAARVVQLHPAPVRRHQPDGGAPPHRGGGGGVLRLRRRAHRRPARRPR